MTVTYLMIVGPVLDPSGAAAANKRITVRLETGTAGGAHLTGLGAVASTFYGVTDSNGLIFAQSGGPLTVPTLDQVTNVTNTYYACTVEGAKYSWNIQPVAASAGKTITWQQSVDSGNTSILVSTPTAPVASGMFLAPGTDASKPATSGLPNGIFRYSTDIQQVNVLASGSWTAAGPTVTAASGTVLNMSRYGGSAITGTSQVIGSTAITDITSATQSFTLPADGRPAEISFSLPICTAPTVNLTAIAYASKDNSTWVNVGSWSGTLVSPTTGGLTAVTQSIAVREVHIPHPLLTSTTASPNDLNAGNTCYLKASLLINAAGSNSRGAYSTGGVSYAVGDGVNSAGLWYICKSAYTSTATLPASDSTHWQAVAVTVYEAWAASGFFGYCDTYTRSKRS